MRVRGLLRRVEDSLFAMTAGVLSGKGLPFVGAQRIAPLQEVKGIASSRRGFRSSRWQRELRRRFA